MKAARPPSLVLRKVSSVILIFSMLIGLALAFAPVIHAASPTVDRTCKGLANPATTITCTISSVPSGDVVIIATTASSPPTSVTVTDNASNTYMDQVTEACAKAGCAGGIGGGRVDIWSFLPTSTHGLLVTFADAGLSNTLWVEGFAVSNIGATPLITGINTCDNSVTCPNAMKLPGVIIIPANSFTVAAVEANAGCTVFAAQTGFTYTSAGAGGTSNGGAEYTSTISGSNDLSLFCSGGAAASWFTIAGASFGPSTTAAPQTQTIGSCPPGGGSGVGHFALANSTIYIYSGNALGQEVVNQITTEVASIKGSGSHTLQVLIYASASNIVNVGNPLKLLYSSLGQFPAISSGTTNTTIATAVAIQINPPSFPMQAGNIWAVGIVGDDHINIAGSGLSGLTTLSGNPSTSAQPTSFTSLGSASTNKLALCAAASYQSLVINAGTTTTTTTTAPATSTTILTSTATSIDINTAASTSTGFTILLLIILTPAMILGGTMGFITRNAGLAMIGFVAGLTVGAGLGNYSGIVPVQWLYIAVILDVLLVIGLVRFGGSGG